jgi:putative sigma-54 modulation protein
MTERACSGVLRTVGIVRSSISRMRSRAGQAGGWHVSPGPGAPSNPGSRGHPPECSAGGALVRGARRPRGAADSWFPAGRLPSHGNGRPEPGTDRLRERSTEQVQLEIEGRHIDVTESMDTHIRERVEHLPKYAESLQYLRVMLDMDSGAELVEITAKCGKADLVAEARSHDMYQSIDEAFGKIEKQLNRYHDRLVKNRSREAQQAHEVDRRPE